MGSFFPPSCKNCGYLFPDRQPGYPCPKCGETSRMFYMTLSAQLQPLGELKGKQIRSGYPGSLISFVLRTKRSWWGRFAREEQRYDRTNPLKTVKTHYVEEMQADGSWKTVHDERVESPAKRTT
jgi:hypothetical protein